MILTEWQNKVAEDTHRFRVLCCGRRAGKTILAVEEIKGKAVANECSIAYIATTYIQARDIAWSTLKKELDSIIVRSNESRLELEVKNVKGTTSTIQLKGWENIETLRGQKFHFIVLDEVASMRNFEINWQEVVRPTLTDYKGEVMFISTPKGFNHFYDLYNKQETDRDYKAFHFTSYDNPHLPVEELDKAKEEVTEDRFSQEYLADFRKTEGLVYKEFDRKTHLFGDEEENKLWFIETILGVDFGYTNPACILQIKKDSDERYFVTNEWYKTKQTTSQIVEKIGEFKPNRVYPDPAEPDRIAEIKKAGYNVMEVSKDIPAGIQVVRDLLKQNRLFIHKSCTNLIWELETYSYSEKKPDKNEEERPIKENDHAMDALRYAIYMASRRKPNFNKEYIPDYSKIGYRR